MTADKLYEILRLLDNLDRELGLQSSLEAIANAVANLASQPAQPQHQSSLAQALGNFETAVVNLRTAITPSQMAAIKAMGGEEFFDASIEEKVKTVIRSNAMTPAVARDFVQQLAARRATFLATVRAARQGLEGLKIQGAKLEPGTADLAFLIPTDLFDNKVGPFAKELSFINRLLEHYSEAVTGTAEPPELEELSSSLPTIGVWAPVVVIGVVSTVVDKFLHAWEKIERIRKVRAELREIGLKGQAVDELTEQITTTVEEVVEESTELVVARYPIDNADRKNELRNAVRQDTKRLFGQIERGLTIEVRANADEQTQDIDEQKILQDIQNTGNKLKFPPVAKEPMLLGSGEIIEGEIRTKHTKKTTTTTQKTSKATGPKVRTPKEEKQETQQ